MADLTKWLGIREKGWLFVVVLLAKGLRWAVKRGGNENPSSCVDRLDWLCIYSSIAWLWFDRADSNHDGVLTRDEMIADAGRFFATLDKDHDGRLTPDERLQLRALLDKLVYG